MSNISHQPQYTHFITDVIERIRSAQYEALKAVNKKQIQLYWDLGKQIVEKQAELGWGNSATIGCRNWLVASPSNYEQM